MKIIDLLNKIANGEKVPKTIIYNSFTYWYDELEKNYYRMVAKDLDDEDVEYLLDNCFASDILNDKVEIIEEDKPIEKIIYTSQFADAEHLELINKVNELIDVVNELKERE